MVKYEGFNHQRVHVQLCHKLTIAKKKGVGKKGVEMQKLNMYIFILVFAFLMAFLALSDLCALGLLTFFVYSIFSLVCCLIAASSPPLLGC